MSNIDATLAASRNAIDQLLATGERAGGAWATPRAPGKWSPSQVVEHVARSLEESAHMASGRASKFPKLPSMLHPVVRRFLFTRVLRNGRFPKAKTNAAMNPATGPASSADGRVRLERAHEQFEDACRQLASRGERMRTTIFGSVGVEDYVRFMELHTRHHERQVAASCPEKLAV